MAQLLGIAASIAAPVLIGAGISTFNDMKNDKDLWKQKEVGNTSKFFVF